MKKIRLEMREGETYLECGINGTMYVLRRGVEVEVPEALYRLLVDAGEVSA